MTDSIDTSPTVVTQITAIAILLQFIHSETDSSPITAFLPTNASSVVWQLALLRHTIGSSGSRVGEDMLAEQVASGVMVERDAHAMD